MRRSVARCCAAGGVSQRARLGGLVSVFSCALRFAGGLASGRGGCEEGQAGAAARGGSNAGLRRDGELL